MFSQKKIKKKKKKITPQKYPQYICNEIETKLQNTNCDRTQKLKLQQN